ncbi:MAG: bifunctional folylpolyglutamate synthase/dihydrofolate synthase [SAR202 cluster bacterium]|nr:bifunctional folylpolyglutamate synthase/dihydrofolate synthase [SAR202 cluster bacterium]
MPADTPGAGPLLDYEGALRLIMGLPDFERAKHSPGHSTFHLERMGLLLERLGNPHQGIPTVHVAGTKGKGSTSAMVTAILTAAGYKTGLYTSPHLHSVTERIRIGNDSIAKQDFADLVAAIWPDIEWAGRQGYGGVSFFEILTLMSFLHFKQAGCGFQVIEVGLGGRLDATNVVSPEVSAITRISLDHVQVLGDTFAKIAREKAGIIKPGSPAVVAPQVDEAMAVFEEVAAGRGAPLVSVSRGMSWTPRGSDAGGQHFEVRSARETYQVRTPLLGEHQMENAATAIAVAETLADKGYAISKDAILEGLRTVNWPGRLQILSKGPVQIVVDGAHNPDSIARLVRAVKGLFKYRQVHVVFGAISGHSLDGMLAELAALEPAQVYAVRSRHPKAGAADSIAAAAAGAGLPVARETGDVGAGVRLAMAAASKGDLVLATGSLSVVAEVIEEIQGIPPELYPTLKGPAGPP